LNENSYSCGSETSTIGPAGIASVVVPGSVVPVVASAVVLVVAPVVVGSSEVDEVVVPVGASVVPSSPVEVEVLAVVEVEAVVGEVAVSVAESAGSPPHAASSSAAQIDRVLRMPGRMPEDVARRCPPDLVVSPSE
jgi:hypothetical protein